MNTWKPGIGTLQAFKPDFRTTRKSHTFRQGEPCDYLSGYALAGMMAVEIIRIIPHQQEVVFFQLDANPGYYSEPATGWRFPRQGGTGVGNLMKRVVGGVRRMKTGCAERPGRDVDGSIEFPLPGRNSHADPCLQRLVVRTGPVSSAALVLSGQVEISSAVAESTAEHPDT